MSGKVNSLMKAVVPGILGGSVFLLFTFILKTDILISIGAAVASYIGIYFVIPAGDKAMEFIVDGITKEDYNNTIKQGLDKVKLLKSLSAKITNSGFLGKLNSVIKVIDEIFDDLHKDPKDVRVARQFLSYYLDTTITIVNRYIDLYNHGEKSEKIAERLAKVESLLDTIRVAFQKQLEKLLDDDIMDLDTEISLLETTFKSEGL